MSQLYLQLSAKPNVANNTATAFQMQCENPTTCHLSSTFFSIPPSQRPLNNPLSPDFTHVFA